MMTLKNMRTARGFTLMEVLIATALGVVVIGSGMLVYLQGNKMYTTVTEHSTFREEAMICLEHISRDVDQLMVSQEQWPDGSFYMVEPFKLVNPYNQQFKEPTTGKLLDVATAGSGVKFFRYHHTDMVTVGTGKQPKLVGNLVEYKTEPIDAGDLKKGVNLMRNGKKVNGIVLSEVIFQKLPIKEAIEQVQGAPNAILKVTVIPRGGMWRQMRTDAIEELKKDGTVLSRNFHLSGYESQYTAMLFEGTQKVKGGTPPANLEPPVVKAVHDDASKSNNPLVDTISTGVGTVPSQAFVPSPGLTTLSTAPFDDNTAGKDTHFAKSTDIFASVGDMDPPPSVNDKFAGSHGGWTGGETLGSTTQPNHCPNPH
jgi:prepilin-type N-terminal cleavage/methylation domain-containing protein